MLLAVTVFCPCSVRPAASAAKRLPQSCSSVAPFQADGVCASICVANASAENIVALEQHLSELLEQSERVQKKGPASWWNQRRLSNTSKL
jgi:hypothetical protein